MVEVGVIKLRATERSQIVRVAVVAPIPALAPRENLSATHEHQPETNQQHDSAEQ
jgi:hypothetical protein